jgi:hypothetical protein
MQVGVIEHKAGVLGAWQPTNVSRQATHEVQDWQQSKPAIGPQILPKPLLALDGGRLSGNCV